MTELLGNTAETVLNAELAALLRGHGLESEAEQSIRLLSQRHQVDVLVELGECAVAIEAEFAPGRTVLADAEKRLPEKPLHWRGLAVDSVFALVYPKELQRQPESRARAELAKRTDLIFERVDSRAVGDVADEKLVRTKHTGSVATLAEFLHNFWIRSSKAGSVEEAVEQASFAIEQASAILRRAARPHPLQDVDSDPEATSALIWLNALLFQELLARNLDVSKLPEEFHSREVPRPEPSGHTRKIREQWEAILEINWWPIFHVACESLREAPPYEAGQALQELIPVAEDIAVKGVIRRHDVAGRIFHRLLGTRKFLATNYTTIPAAVLLASLAFDGRRKPWNAVDWSSPSELAKLRIVDPACGTGTLLMAALQEVLTLHRRSGGDSESQGATIRRLLENALHGYDVVPAAVHLTAATLSMAETRLLIGPMPLFWMRHDVHQGRARLGSLDFLEYSPSRGIAQQLPAFVDTENDPGRVTGTGERVYDAQMPGECDLVIANPPYTRAGGPGSSEHTDWNPIFGSALSKADAQAMQNALRRTLHGSPASLYAGLGSAFIMLARQKVKAGGRIAFVLPATALTGSRWNSVREMLLRDFDVEWVVVSHDVRSRNAKAGLPGRLFVAFSESTRIAETLIVATKKGYEGAGKEAYTQFVNLRRNPDEPIEAMAVARALLEAQSLQPTVDPQELRVGDTVWGEVLTLKQAELDAGAWTFATFMQGRLADLARTLANEESWWVDGREYAIPITELGDICELGPYHMQVKNPTQGLFDIVETEDPTRTGSPAIWHHRSDRIRTIETGANARLQKRPDKDPNSQSEMLARASRLHLAGELRHAPQRVAAVLTEQAMLGVRSWITLSPKQPSAGKEEALCLWLNGTLGLLLRIVHANRPYLGRSSTPHELARRIPVLDVDRLTVDQLEAARKLFEDLRRRPLLGFAHVATDPARRELDHRFFREVLGHSADAELDQLSEMLNREPTLTTRH